MDVTGKITADNMQVKHGQFLQSKPVTMSDFRIVTENSLMEVIQYGDLVTSVRKAM